MIEIRNLQKNFGDNKAIDGLSTSIHDGSVFALLGVNGSGKSTLLRLISGVYQKDGGEIFYNGRSLNDVSLRKDFLYIGDELLFKGESLDSLFLYYSTFYGLTKERYEHYLKLFEIDLEKRRLSHFSKGMQRRVYLAIGLAISPKVLILDEAFDGLDIVGKTVFKKELFSILGDDPEKIVIIASHSIKEVEDLCDRFVILKKGKIIFDSGKETATECCKAEIGFKDEFDFGLFEKEGFIILHSTKKVATLLAEKSAKEVEDILCVYEPALLDIGELSAEELFLLKSEGAKDGLQ